ncbi:MAG: carboxyl-terminal protease [Leptolyngbya sp.]|nr:MAG: carboxyl-terminal protease [Leptolyngbya sp.]
MKQKIFWMRQLFLLVLVVVITFGGWASPAIALTEEQRFVSEAWRLVDRAYVDDTFNHQNWWLVRQKALKHALPDHESAYSEIQTMLAGLGDPFTRLLKPDQYRSLQTNTSGELTGVGLQISLDAETKVLKVIAPIAGSPADRAGVQPADTILKIDAVPTAGLSLDEAAERMRGSIGSRVVLTIQRPGSDPSDVAIVRDRIALNPVTFELRVADSQSAERPKTKIGYVRLAQFNANATAEVSRAINQLEKQGAEAYVLDLRSNPGGLLLSGIEIARLWMDEGTIVYTVNRQGIEGSFEATGQALTKDPLVVLVNQGTASASEILAGALKDNQRATILGERTFGKGLIQSLFDLSDGAGLAVTVAKYQTPDHIDINKQGIKPDVIVPLDPLAITPLGTQRDRQYEAAVEFLTTPSMVAGAT